VRNPRLASQLLPGANPAVRRGDLGESYTVKMQKDTKFNVQCIENAETIHQQASQCVLGARPAECQCMSS
jgi:hypothetical protein